MGRKGGLEEGDGGLLYDLSGTCLKRRDVLIFYDTFFKAVFFKIFRIFAIFEKITRKFENV